MFRASLTRLVVLLILILSITNIATFGNTRRKKLNYNDVSTNYTNTSHYCDTGRVTNPSASPLNLIYHSSPNKFLVGLSSCMLDPTCHILYEHVAKTGGQGIESLFFNVFGHQGYSPCCGEKLRRRFRNNPREICMKKFSSYEVNQLSSYKVPNGFEEFPYTCNEIYNNNETTTQGGVAIHQSEPSALFQERHKLIVLTSWREPIARTLSNIHQLCNKNWKWRDNQTREACTACDFNQHPDFWMKFANDTLNRDHTMFHSAAVYLQEFQHYWIDMEDINVMLNDLKEYFPRDNYKKALDEYFARPHNPELLTKCEFSMHSKMIKALRPSSTMYRNFTRGFVPSV